MVLALANNEVDGKKKFYSAISIVPFVGRLIVGLACCVSLHKKWNKTYPKLFRYSWIDQIGTCIIYVSGQLWITLIIIIGDPIVSLNHFQRFYQFL